MARSARRRLEPAPDGNLADVLVTEDLGQVTRGEEMRVLCPNGVAPTSVRLYSRRVGGGLLPSGEGPVNVWENGQRHLSAVALTIVLRA